MKKEFKKRFKELYDAKKYELACVQLDGFSHRLYYYEGDELHVDVWSAYSDKGNEKLTSFFSGCPHYAYQGNPKEIIYIMPRK